MYPLKVGVFVLKLGVVFMKKPSAFVDGFFNEVCPSGQVKLLTQ